MIKNIISPWFNQIQNSQNVDEGLSTGIYIVTEEGYYITEEDNINNASIIVVG